MPPLTLKKAPANKYVPNAYQRALVAALIECGIPHSVIRQHKLINCSQNTFKRAYKNEIENAKAVADQEIISCAYRLARSGKVPAMTMFWLKTRCGWREKDRDANTTPAVDIAAIIKDILASLDDSK